MTAIPLSSLKKGTYAYIDSIAPQGALGDMDDLVGRRLADLGFSSGMPLVVIAAGAFGRAPFVVRLGNQSQFALRMSEAEKILCRLTDERPF